MEKWENERKLQASWPPELGFLIRWFTEDSPIIHKGLELGPAERVTDPEAYRASLQAMIDEQAHHSARNSGQLQDMLARLYAAVARIDIIFEYHRKMPTFDLKKKRQDLERTGSTKGRAYRAVVQVLEERGILSA